ncbi:SpoIIE family protein phosphatase [Phytomonospora sp. NPDC050363]|uniref:SpoIIE family protein phosphatase n=1 Tax=Phytomonospora sp. NPDC050363 TaxID=3155642 RepID=UPI0033F19A99
MSVNARRRLRLPADHQSPAAARALVREVLVEAGFTDLLDEAMLLTTELSTNGVVHAGTDLDVEVTADDDGVTVTVTDFRGGPLEPLSTEPPDEMAEHGRGLLLVDRFATAWGTTHDATGKGVWFRLEHGTRSTPQPHIGVAPVAPATSIVEPVAAEDAAERIAWLVSVPDELRSRLTLPQLVSELLLRLCEVTGAAGGAVWLDEGDGSGDQQIGRYGQVPDTDPIGAVTVPLTMARPLSGRLVLYPESYAERSWVSLASLSADRMALTIEADRLRAADVRRRSWLTFLAEASELLAQSLNVDLTLALVPQIMVPRLGEWCTLWVADEWGELKPAAGTHREESQWPVVKRLLSGPDSELIERLQETVELGLTVPLTRPLEGVAVPLSARGKVLGVLTLGRPVDRLHAPDDITVIEDIARRAALALDNARIHAERQRIAQAFQQALLPAALPSPPGIEFAAEYVPASTGTDVGGDFYDVLEVEPGRFLVSAGDVCGKGPQAAAVTGVVRDVLRALARQGLPLPRIIELLNRTLLEQPDEGRYATLITAMIERRGEELHVEMCLSGHERALHLKKVGECEFVGIEGTAVGLLEQVKVTITELSLAPGDSLLFYTDGVTERRNGDVMFGLRGVCRAVTPLAGHSAAVVTSRLKAITMNFSPDAPKDDIAILGIHNTASDKG